MSSEDTQGRRTTEFENNEAESQTDKEDTVQVQNKDVVTSGLPNSDVSETCGKDKRFYIIVNVVLIVVVLIVLFLVTLLFFSSFTEDEKVVSIILEPMTVLVGLICGTLGVVISFSKRSDEKATQQRFKKDLEKSLSDKDEHYNYLGHLKLNWDKLQGYYDISKKQANSSFVWAIVCFFVGIAIIASTVVVPVWVAFSSTDGFKNYNLVVAIVGAVSGAITEFFAATVMFVYKRSLEQMNFYHDALAHYQTYLSCVNLASLISNKDDPKRDKIFNEIIMSNKIYTKEKEN